MCTLNWEHRDNSYNLFLVRDLAVLSISATLYCSFQSVGNSVKPPNDCDQATHCDHEKSKAHNAKPGIVEVKDLPGSRNDRGVEADNCDHQHSVLLCHRSAKLVRRARDFSCGANISGEDR